jgi:predicted DNA-binding transcriptional regulator YafY
VVYPAEDDIEMAYAGTLLNFGIKGSQGTEYTVTITLDRKVMEYGENAEIISPERYRNKFKDAYIKALSIYND